jgi:hypothetical protein
LPCPCSWWQLEYFFLPLLSRGVISCLLTPYPISS